MRDEGFSRGVASAFAGACAWGLSGAMIQFIFSRYEISPLLMTAFRMLGAGALFLIVLIARRREQLHAMLADADSRRRLLVFGSLGLFANSALYSTTVLHTNAGTATVMQTSSAALLLALACLRVRRLPSARELAALICALAATLLIATGGRPGTLALSPAGLAAGCAMVVATAFYIAYPAPLFARWGSLAVTGVGMAVGGISALATCLVTGAVSAGLPAIDALGIAMIVLNIVIGTFGAYGLYLHGVSIVGSVNGSMIGAVEPVSATLFSALWLGTAFGWADWVGLVLMVACVTIIAGQESEAR